MAHCVDEEVTCDHIRQYPNHEGKPKVEHQTTKELTAKSPKEEQIVDAENRRVEIQRC